MFNIINYLTSLIGQKLIVFQASYEKSTYEIDTWIPSNYVMNTEVIKWVNFVHVW